MKTVIKSRIFAFVLGIIIAGGIGVAAYTYNASQITYTPSDTSWSVRNVGDAIDDLKNGSGGTKPELLWTNPSPTTSVGAHTIELDLSEYKYVIIVCKDKISGSNTNKYSTGLVPVNLGYATAIGRVETSTSVRHFTATDTGVSVSIGRFGSSSGGSENETVIPYKIYGVKDDLNIDVGL